MPKVRFSFQPLLAITAIILLLIISIALSSGMTREELEYRPLSLGEVTQVFNRKGLRLEPYEKERFQNTVLFGVEPEVYRIQNTEDLVFIYPFSSHGEREKLVGHYWRFDSEMMDTFMPYSQLFQTFMAKNMFIVYCPFVDIETIKPGELAHHPFIQRSKTINNLVFRDLNGGKTLIFRGEGQYWEVETVFSHYNHFYKDDRGVLGYDRWDMESTMARYKGNDPSEVGVFNFRMEGPHGSHSGTGFTLDPDGFVRLGGGSSALNSAEDTYTFTVEWNGKRETFELRVHPAGFTLFTVSKI